MLEIPIFKDISADFEQTVLLENINVTIRLTYNIRSACWRMNISTALYTITGLKLIVNFPIIEWLKASFPELTGDFFVFQTNTKKAVDFNFNSFGVDHFLFYLTAQEVLEWKEHYGLEA